MVLSAPQYPFTATQENSMTKQTKTTDRYTVSRDLRGARPRWAVIDSTTGMDVEGGFFRKAAAQERADEWNEEHRAEEEQRKWEAEEEARELVWYATGGPARMTEEHRQLANASIEELEAAGWKVIDRTFEREPFEDVALTTIVIRPADDIRDVRVLRWNTFNRFWMLGHKSGGWSSVCRADLKLAE